jgi:PRTRC genetic system ThiF family protein
MIPVQFEPPYLPHHILLVGAGGTGAQWARSIARCLWDMRERGQQAPSLTVVDPDFVEMKNVGRQLFAPGDVGLPKAEAVARRLNYALGLDIRWKVESFSAALLTRSTLLCGAVDNHEARLAIHQSLRGTSHHRHLYIDAGNHPTSGQVVIGNTTDPAQLSITTYTGGKLGRYPRTGYLPVAGLLFPALLEPEEAPAPSDLWSPLSCAEALEAGAQHLLINDLIATVAASYTLKLLNRQPIETFLSYVDIDGPTVRSVEISADALSERLG